MKVLRKIFSILNYVITTILVVILALTIYLFIQINILHKSYTNIFGFTFFQVKSGSMESEIQINDIVIDKIIKPKEELRVGDIISFQEDKSIITHRILKIDGDMITTKGDANNTADKPIDRSQVIAKVVKIIPNISIWMSVVTTKSVYIPAFVSVLLLILMSTIKVDDKNNFSSNTKEDTLEEMNEEQNKEEKKTN